MKEMAIVTRHATRKLCIIEANEVPLRVWQTYAERYPTSAVARLLMQGKVFQTVADDVEEEELYPSQTWASLNTGLPYEEHGIHWYNDPKPDRQRFWWHQAACRGKRVGLVNVLHSSPLSEFAAEGDYAFLIPDCFAADSHTLPDSYRHFQELNLRFTRSSGRVASLSPSDLLHMAARAAAHPGCFGVDAFSLGESLRALPALMHSRERLRNMQFPPLASMFLQLLRKHDPDIGIVFTNHIAAAQHRYWYALFPDDYAERLYDDAWIARYRDEILNAVGLMDRYLARVSAYCAQTRRILLLVSSMGQCANRQLKQHEVRQETCFYRIDDPMRFLAAVAGTVPAECKTAMVPQYTYAFGNAAALDTAAAAFRSFIADNPAFGDSCIDVSGNTLTLTLAIGVMPETLNVGARRLSLHQLGIGAVAVDDHHSGRHHPLGMLLVWNDEENALFNPKDTPDRFSYLDYASRLRSYLGLPMTHAMANETPWVRRKISA
jgi:hypothetical protein